ncbi:hypothetical protein [Accumulibacter sp.]|uniref:hypothetical protein n=1 Tax=Accumulibacter sp. TaxID=2053492 RepID=UPI0025E68B48|nr:hypothetical protein [Accumulibacter sp.]MCM8593849.1 hypothetical protein [Accumulibacter sp.]MCM8626109.1 hypothetical protein [Accumulibacter sp.]MDS4047990.1 hypothetical protein [Accumulibacter sp.]
MSAVLVESLILPAGIGLRFLDAWSGTTIGDGLSCTLRRRRDGRLLGIARCTPSGIHHWPDLAPLWAERPVSPPQPGRAEVIVEDRLTRYLPVRLPWPPETDRPGEPIASLMLASAPGRPAPPGAATVFALLADDSGAPAGWARVLACDAQGRTTIGMSDAAGRLALHLPFPRPDRRQPASPPDSPPPPPGVSATITLRVFHDPAVASDALAAAQRQGLADGLPSLPDWSAQAEVRALARAGSSDALGPLRLEPDRPAVPVTEGLPSNRSELRLTPL